MTQETATKLSPSEPPVDKMQRSVEGIVESLKGVGDDIGQINKLSSEEKHLVAQFFASMQKLMPLLKPSIAVSISALPTEIGDVSQAQIDSTGHLSLTFENGHQKLVDLSELKNRDLMVAVVGDIMPKLNDLTSQSPDEELQEPAQVQEAPPPPAPAAPELVEAVNVEPPVGLADAAPTEVPQEEPLQQEALEAPAVPALSAEVTAKIAAIEAETLDYLDMLGNEVFEQSPVSKYFDDWMVNLRQVILSFESNDVVGPDEAFTNEYNKIFGEIEDELAKRQATEADIEVSARSLVESRYLLNKIDEGYAAQTKELVVKGKDAIDYLTRNVQQLEKELTEVAQIKVSYRHLLQKRAKDQKQAELAQKLNAAKKRLALAVGTSSVDHGKSGDIDTEYAAQTQELADKRKSAMDILTTEVHALEEELVQIEKIKTVNPIKRVAKEQKRFEVTEKLDAAKKRLELAEQNSNAEQERLREEYEKKKQATLGKMQTLEKDIATKATDNSAEVRKQATTALVNAVKSRIRRKTASPQIPEDAPKATD
jgi:hypothetical protein